MHRARHLAPPFGVKSAGASLASMWSSFEMRSIWHEPLASLARWKAQLWPFCTRRPGAGVFQLSLRCSGTGCEWKVT